MCIHKGWTRGKLDDPTRWSMPTTYLHSSSIHLINHPITSTRPPVTLRPPLAGESIHLIHNYICICRALHIFLSPWTFRGTGQVGHWNLPHLQAQKSNSPHDHFPFSRRDYNFFPIFFPTGFTRKSCICLSIVQAVELKTQPTKQLQATFEIFLFPSKYRKLNFRLGRAT